MPSDAPLLLAIDTGGEQVALALYDGQLISEIVYDAGREHTRTVLPEIRHLLALNCRRLEEVGAVAVTTGPGSFNGLRVGMSIAKALAYALGVPLLGILTLDALAYPHTSVGLPIRAFVAAGRGRVVYGDYHLQGNGWVRDSTLRSVRVEELTSGLVTRTVLVGVAPGEALSQLRSHPFVLLPPPSFCALRPAWVAELAYRRWQSGEQDPLAALEPVYVHGAGVEVLPPVQLPMSYASAAGQE